jgi:hypothetical protein
VKASVSATLARIDKPKLNTKLRERYDQRYCFQANA